MIGLMGFAKRGKIMQSSSHQKFTVPQKFFGHFYVAAVAWTTVLLVTTWTYAYNMVPFTSQSTEDSHIISVWRSVFLLLLMEVQVLRRLFETLYVFNYSSSARLHIFGYLTGYFFYTLAPISLCYNHAHEVYKFSVNGVAEILVKGNTTSVQEFYLLEFLSPFLKLGWLQWTGAAIFFWGWIHQRNCHKILGSLRKNRTQNDSYMIPYGDWFELVSSPHFLAEIVIYVGFVVASGGADLTVWLLLGFTVSNLTFAA
uniref:polyprenol reductase 2-like n=1 Tax=Fragaria vesca subsp. vesca TaxID=101020 RepID=UPI0005C9FBF3|nr:PREDICTED: polyprenol reductase 2-like [Fragaria vesca subsp. vesca]